MTHRVATHWLRLFTLLVLVAGSGATCQRPLLTNPFAAAGAAAPHVLAPGASREQVVAAVNQNSARIRSLSVTGASITIPDMMGLPLLSGNIAAERPGRFRLTAGTALSGQEIDLGSNDELFWMWVRRNQPPAVYFCRHSQFANSNIRQVMPIEPAWLLAALGMIDIDPATVYEGPTPRGGGKVELRTWLPSASGNLSRVLLIDAGLAWVVEQHVYDPTGSTLLASAVAESHRYYEAEQVSLPDRVSIRLPTAGIAFKIGLGAVQINRLPGDAGQLWTMPAFDGYPQYDLGGAVPGTPLPGQPVTQSGQHPISPATHLQYPTTANPTATAIYSAPAEAPPAASAAPANVNYIPPSGTPVRYRRY